MISFENKSLVGSKVILDPKVTNNRYIVELKFLDEDEAKKLNKTAQEYFKKKVENDGV